MTVPAPPEPQPDFVLRVGNQSAFSAPLCAPFEFAVRHGFDAFEWFPDKRADGAGWGCADFGPTLRQEVRARARDSGIRLSVHAPIPADPLRAGSSRDLEESLRLAVDLGAGLLNIHFSDPKRVEELASVLPPWIQRCAISGVRLAIENVPATSAEDFNRLFALLPRQGPGPARFGMCLDIGHANLNPLSRNDYVGFVERLRPEVPIIHLHLHENHGDQDNHLVLFTGPSGKDPSGLVSLFGRLRRRGFDGNAVLEQWPNPPELLVAARERLLTLVQEGLP